MEAALLGPGGPSHDAMVTAMDAEEVPPRPLVTCATRIVNEDHLAQEGAADGDDHTAVLNVTENKRRHRPRRQHVARTGNDPAQRAAHLRRRPSPSHQWPQAYETNGPIFDFDEQIDEVDGLLDTAVPMLCEEQDNDHVDQGKEVDQQQQPLQQQCLQHEQSAQLHALHDQSSALTKPSEHANEALQDNGHEHGALMGDAAFMTDDVAVLEDFAGTIRRQQTNSHHVDMQALCCRLRRFLDAKQKECVEAERTREEQARIIAQLRQRVSTLEGVQARFFELEERTGSLAAIVDEFQCVQPRHPF